MTASGDLPPSAAAPEPADALRAKLAESEELAQHLQRALATNRRIGIAIGIVMRERRCTEEQALEALRQVSMQGNVKLRDIAEVVIYSGTL